MKLDLDRGVITRWHPNGGFDVHMYADEPGVWYDSHGKEVPASIAKGAGYEVDRLMQEKALAEQIAVASAKVHKEMKRTTEATTVAERGGFELVRVAPGLFKVKNPDGQFITRQPVAETIGRVLLDEFGGPNQEAATTTEGDGDGGKAS